MSIRKVLLIITAVPLLLAYITWVFVPSNPPPRNPTSLPWQITPTEDGSIRVFGITLGRDTLGEAIAAIPARYEFGVFRDPDGELSLEVYFKDARLSGLTARIVASGGMDPGTLRELVGETQGKRLEGGIQQYPIPEASQDQALAAPVIALTYVPYIRLDEQIITDRFGRPAERVPENAEAEHWLYPELGLDLLLDADGKAILQYVPPREFDKLREPLMQGRTEETS